jgi:multisubunit Na+/H+ antiporter MnhF subunit
MYSTLLAIHSWFRWLVLLSLVIAVYRSYTGWRSDKRFTKLDNFTRHTTATVLHIQFTIGIVLYLISPIVTYFLHNFNEAVHLREIRFFGMEHIVMMVTAVIVITIGSIKTKRRSTDQRKFKTMLTWYSGGLMLILASIPWGVLFLVSRPFFRAF